MADSSGGAIVWNLDVLDSGFTSGLDEASAKTDAFKTVVSSADVEVSDSLDSVSKSAGVTSSSLETVGISGKEAGSSFVTAGADIRTAGVEAGESATLFEGLSDTIRETVIPLAALFVGYKAVEDIFKDVNDDTNVYNTAQAQLENTISKTNNTLGLTIKQLDDLAEANSKNTDITGAADLAAENILATYQLSGTVFESAAKVVNDLGTSLANIRGQAVPSLLETNQAATLLGRALANPSNAAGTLTRANVKLTAAQEDVIKTMQTNNGLAAAQTQLLSDLATMTSGKAAASVDTYQGHIASLQKTVYELSGTYIKGLQDAVEQVSRDFVSFATVIINNKPLLLLLEGAVIALTTALAVGLALALFSVVAGAIASAAAFTVLGAPIGLIAAVVAGVGAGIFYLVNALGGLHQIAQDLVVPMNYLRTIFVSLGAAFTGADPTVNLAPAWAKFGEVLYPIQIASLALQEAFKGLILVVEFLGQLFVDALPTLEAIGDYVGNTLSGIFSSLGNIIYDAVLTIDPVLSGLFAFFEAHRVIILDIAKAFAVLAAVMVLTPVVTALAAITVALKALEIALDFISDHFTLFKNIMLVSLGVVFLPLVVTVGAIIAAFKLIPPVVDAVSDAIGAVTNAIAVGFDAVVSAISTAYEAIVSVSQTIASVVVDAFTTILNIVTTVMTAVWHFIEPILNFLKNLFIVFFGGIAVVILDGLIIIKNYIIDAWDGIYDVLKVVLGFISNLIVGAWNFIYFDVSSLLKAIETIIITVWQAIFNFISPIIASTTNAIADAWDHVYAVVSDVFNKLFTAMTAVWNAIYGFISGIVGAIIGYFAQAGDWLYQKGSDIIGGLTSGIASVSDTVGGAIKKAADEIGAFFSGAASWLYDVGKDIVQGLVDGIESMVGAVTSAAGKIGDSVQSKVKSLLGIHSPSTVFHEIGQNIGQGLINGIGSTQSAAQDAIGGLVEMSNGVNSGLNVETANSIGNSMATVATTQNSPQVNVSINNSGIVAQSRSAWRDIMKDGITAVNEELKARRLPLIADGKLSGSSTS